MKVTLTEKDFVHIQKWIDVYTNHEGQMSVDELKTLEKLKINKSNDVEQWEEYRSMHSRGIVTAFFFRTIDQDENNLRSFLKWAGCESIDYEMECLLNTIEPHTYVYVYKDKDYMPLYKYMTMCDCLFRKWFVKA